jgi:hypothetical protein
MLGATGNSSGRVYCADWHHRAQGQVATILLGAGVKAAYQQQTTNRYDHDHASLLRLTMDSLGLTTQLPISNATPMTEFFQ